MQEIFRKSYIDCLNIEKRKNPTCWSVSALISFSVRRAQKNTPYRVCFFTYRYELKSLNAAVGKPNNGAGAMIFQAAIR